MVKLELTEEEASRLKEALKAQIEQLRQQGRYSDGYELLRIKDRVQMLEQEAR